MNRKKKIRFTSVGGSSILTIFAVLCFIIFALLTLSTAKADRKIADRSVEAVLQYYEADTQAEEILASIRSGKIPEEVTKETDSLYSYSCPIDENQTLQVKIRVKDESYEILEWKKVYIGPWKADDTIEVFGGTEILD